MANNERKYFVKQSWIFNLESMHDKLSVIEIDLDEGNLKFPIEVVGKIINNYTDLYDLRDEASELEWIAKSRKVTSKEYGRIKVMVEWRVMQRYATCMASGMAESDAGLCFTDM